MEEVQVRASRRLGLFALAVGVFGLVLLLAVESIRSPLLIFAVLSLFFSGGLLMFDRRVKLAISEAGIRYSRWGPSVIPWHEFSGYRWSSWRQQPHLQLLPRRPTELAASFSAYGKLNHFSYRVARMPPFSIAAPHLDIDYGSLEQLVARYLPAQPHA